MTNREKVLGAVIAWLRLYQMEVLLDDSRYVCILKARQIGVSDVLALKIVLIASGLVDLVDEMRISSHNCTIISKTGSDATDVVDKCKMWIKRLRLVDEFEPYLRTSTYSTTEIKFEDSNYRIISQTQNPEAGRSKTGHLIMDEYAFYQFQRRIFMAAAASTESRRDLTITIISTPNGQGDHFHEICTEEAYEDWSHHRIDVYRAAAEGFPIDIAESRKKYTANGWAQEMECVFLGGVTRTFSAELLAEVTTVRTDPAPLTCVLGIDAASVVDNTSIQDLGTGGKATWLRDNYTISGLPYVGTPGRLGQVDIVEAIVRELRPEIVSVDQTGDNANTFTRDSGGLYLNLKPRLRGLCRLVPVTITNAWKNTHVPRLKTAMDTKRLLIDIRRRDLIWSNAGLGVPAEQWAQILATGFEESPFPILMSDFKKVHQKWTGTHKTTYETGRDDSGHGDAFWSAGIGYSAVGMGSGGSDLDRKLRAIMTSEPSSDYAEYI